MTTSRNLINSNFWQVANVDANGTVVGIISENYSSGNSNITIDTNANITLNSNGVANVVTVSAQTNPTNYTSTAVAVLGATTVILNNVTGLSVGQVINAPTFLPPGTTITNIAGVTITVSNALLIQAPIGTVFYTTAPTSAVDIAGNLTVGGESNLGPIGNVTITGGSNGQALFTDGAGNLSWVTISADKIVNGNSNVVVAANANITVGSNGVANVVRISAATNPTNYTSTAIATVGATTISLDTVTGLSTGQVLNAPTFLPPGTTITGISGLDVTVSAAVILQAPIGTTFFTTAPSSLVELAGGLDVGGPANLGPVGNVTITGGSDGQALFTDGAGNLSWVTISADKIVNGNSNVVVAANANVTVGSNGIANVVQISASTITNTYTSTATALLGATTVTLDTVAGLTNGQVLNAATFLPPGTTVTGVAGLIATVSNAFILEAPIGTTFTTGTPASLTRIAGNLTVGGQSNLGPVGNVVITGGSNGQALFTDGSGNLSWVTISADKIVNGNSNVVVAPNANVTVSSNGVANVVTVNAAILTNTYTTTANSANGASTLTLDTVAGLLVGDILIGANILSPGTVVTNIANLVVTVDQPLINAAPNGTAFTTVENTSRVTLADAFAVLGKSNLNAVGNVTITGGTTGQFLQTDGNGNLSWATVGTAALTNGNSNVIVGNSEAVTISAVGQANIIVVNSNGTHAQTTITNDVTITGNLNVQGNATYINTTSQTITDPIFDIGVGANNTPLVTNDALDRGMAMHSYGAGASYVTNGVTPAANTFIAIANTVGITVGMEIGDPTNGTLLTKGTTVVAVNANSNIEISNATLGNIPAATTLGIGSDIIRFVGWDTGNVEMVLASNVTIANNVITVNELGNTRLGNLIGRGNIDANANGNNAFMTFTTNGNNANMTFSTANTNSAVALATAANASNITLNTTGINSRVIVNTTGNTANIQIGTTGLDSHIASNTTGNSSNILSSTTGVSSRISQSTTGNTSNITTSTTGVESQIIVGTTGNGGNIVTSTTGINANVTFNTSGNTSNVSIGASGVNSQITLGTTGNGGNIVTTTTGVNANITFGTTGNTSNIITTTTGVNSGISFGTTGNGSSILASATGANTAIAMFANGNNSTISLTANGNSGQLSLSARNDSNLSTPAGGRIFIGTLVTGSNSATGSGEIYITTNNPVANGGSIFTETTNGRVSIRAGYGANIANVNNNAIQLASATSNVDIDAANASLSTVARNTVITSQASNANVASANTTITANGGPNANATATTTISSITNNNTASLNLLATSTNRGTSAVLRASGNANSTANVTNTVTIEAIGANARIALGISPANSNTSANIVTVSSNLVLLGNNTNIQYGNVGNVAEANAQNDYFPMVLDSTGVIRKQPVVSSLSPVIDNTINTPPASPALDDSYLVPSFPTALASASVATTNTLAILSGGTITYNNGTSGVGATLTTTGTWAGGFDGGIVVIGQRVLVKNQVSTEQNGVYIVTSATVLTRATDFDTSAEMIANTPITVTGGSTQAGTSWTLNATVATVGTSAIVWNENSWVGQTNNIATWTGSTWSFYTPVVNNVTTVLTGVNAGNAYLWNGTAWVLQTVNTTLPISNWSLSSSYISGALVVYQGVIYQANAAIPANTAFAIGTTGATWRSVSNGGGALATQTFTATSGQTVFTGLTVAPVGNVMFYINGVMIAASATTVSGTTVTYVPANNASYALVAGDIVTIVYFYGTVNANLVAAEYGVNNGITNGATVTTTLVDIAGSSFTLPSAGVWQVLAKITYDHTGVAQFGCGIYDSTNTLVPGSWATDVDSAPGAGGTNMVMVAQITTTGSATYKLRGLTDTGTVTIKNTGGTVGGGNSTINWEKIGGYTPVTGFIGTQTQFGDIASTGNITATGNISATGNILAVPNWTTGTITGNIGAVTTAPTLPASGVGFNTLNYKRVGSKTYQVQGMYSTGGTIAGGSAGTGDYLLTLPLGLSFDTSALNQAAYTGALGLANGATYLGMINSRVSFYYQSGFIYAATGYIVPYNATQYRVVFITVPAGASYSAPASIVWGSTTYPVTTPIMAINWQFEFQAA